MIITALIYLIEILACVVVAALPFLLVPVLLEEWRNPPKSWVWHEYQRLEKARQEHQRREAQRQKLIDQL